MNGLPALPSSTTDSAAKRFCKSAQRLCAMTTAWGCVSKATWESLRPNAHFKPTTLPSAMKNVALPRRPPVLWQANGDCVNHGNFSNKGLH